MHAPDAIAFEAATALDAYEARLEVLFRSDAQPWMIAQTDAEIRQIWCWCLHLPQLSMACVALLLSHYRLMGELGSQATKRGTAARLAHIQSHTACIAFLRQQCGMLLFPARLQ